jgi:hypothetical protein
MSYPVTIDSRQDSWGDPRSLKIPLNPFYSNTPVETVDDNYEFEHYKVFSVNGYNMISSSLADF